MDFVCRQLESQNRTPVEDVAAIYFIQPTQANIQRLRLDLSQDLYAYYCFHFSNPISRSLLEELAQMCVQYGVSKQVIQVVDEYSDFICLEDDLFTLEVPNSFSLLNDPKIKEPDMQQFLANMATNLLSVCVTLDITPPYIRFEKATPSEAIGVQLESKLKDHYYNYPTRRSGSGVLLILDRLADLPTSLRHCWTYGGMIYDLFDVKCNQIKLKVVDDTLQKHVRKVLDIDASDYFWKSHHCKPFDQVAKELDQELKNYKLEAEKMSLNLTTEQMNQLDHHSGIKSALTVMPELERRKRLLDIHMNLAMSLLEQVQQRQLDRYYELETMIMSQRKPFHKSAIQDWCKDLKGSPEDKLRLLLLFYLKSSDMSKADLKTLFLDLVLAQENSALPELQHEYGTVIDFFVELKALQRMTTGSVTSPSPPASSPKLNTFREVEPSSDFGSQLSSQLTTHYNYVGGVLGNFISNVKTTLMSDGTKDIPLLRQLENLVNLPFLEDSLLNTSPQMANSKTTGKNSTNYQFGNLVQTDPLRKKGLLSSTATLAADSTCKIIIFVMGSLSFEEYLHIKEYILKRFPKVHLTIGSTQLLSPKDIFQQISLLTSRT